MAAFAFVFGLFFAVHVFSLVIPGPEQIAVFENFNSQEGATVTYEKKTKYPERIAIIGSGITGAVTAFNLREGFRSRAPLDQQPSITVFERNPVVGGRITQAYAYNSPLYPVDTCASYFALTDTCIATSLADVGLLPALLDAVVPRAGIGIWNGHDMVGFVEEDGFRGAQTWSEYRKAKYYERYGNNPETFDQQVLSTRVQYDLLLALPAIGLPPEAVNPGRGNLSAEIERAGLTGFVQNFLCSGDDGDNVLPRGEKGSRFTTEVITAGERERFFGNLEERKVLEFLLGFEEEIPIFVEGGNLRLIERLLSLATNDIRLNTDVQRLERIGDDKIAITSSSGPGGIPTDEIFDTVVLATSLELANLTIEPPLEKMPGLEQKYRNSFVTHFTTPGRLNASYFNRDGIMPQSIFTSASIDDVADGKEPPFFSLALQRNIFPPDNTGTQEYLYRLISREEVPDAEIAHFLTKLADSGDKPLITWIDRQPLPRSVPVMETDIDLCMGKLEKIEIAPGIYYAGGGEQVLAFAEFGCRMGSNTADLILDGEFNQP